MSVLSETSDDLIYLLHHIIKLDLLLFPFFGSLFFAWRLVLSSVQRRQDLVYSCEKVLVRLDRCPPLLSFCHLFLFLLSDLHVHKLHSRRKKLRLLAVISEQYFGSFVQLLPAGDIAQVVYVNLRLVECLLVADVIVIADLKLA